MKCIKCRENNINKAKFCKKCGYSFNDLEREAAKKRTLIGKIEWLEKIYKRSTLKFITGHILFKIASLLLVLFTGLFFVYKNGLDLKLLENTYYKINYNEVLNEYYLLTSKNEISLDMYIPNRVENIKINHYNNLDKLIESTTYKKNETILNANVNDYYTLEINYSNDVVKTLKLYVLKK